MNNGTTEKVIEHFNRVALLPDKWDHNQQYQNYMLRQIKKRCKTGLDIGCGTGEFSKFLTQKCDSITGIDIAPKMIEEATKRNPDKNIKYFVTDVNSFLASKEESFDVIVSIATFHHLDFEDILKKCDRALKNDGLLIVQDLYKENTRIFKFMSAVGFILNPIIMLLKNGRATITNEEKEVWKHHGDDDFYNSIAEIREMSKKVLSDCKIKRHMFWRYTLVYYKSKEKPRINLCI